MTHCDTKQLASSRHQETTRANSLSLARKVATMTKSGRVRSTLGLVRDQPRPETPTDNPASRWRVGLAFGLLFLVCTFTPVWASGGATLLAQAPGVETPEALSDGTTAAPSIETSDVDFDLETEEFEGFGEEGFQVEEEDYFRDTVLPIAIKVAIAAAVVLLLAWIARKLVKPKPPTLPEQ